MTKRHLLALLASLIVLCWTAAALANQPVFRAGHDQDFIRLVLPYRLGQHIVGDAVLTNIEIHPDHVEFEIKGNDGKGPRLAVLRMSVDDKAKGGFRYSTKPDAARLDPATKSAVERLEAAVRGHAGPAFVARVLVRPKAHSPPSRGPDRSPLYWVLAVLGIALLLGWSGFRNTSSARDSIPRFAIVCVATLLAIVALGFCVSSWGQVFAHWIPGWAQAWRRDRAVARLALAVTLAGLLATAVRAIARRRATDTSSSTAGRRTALLAVLGVLAWSLLVRLVWTRANILTDGGSGYRRLMDFVGGFGGLSVIVDLLAPHHMMWSAIRVPVVMSALAPALLTVFARQIGLRRPIPFLAGLMLASIPLHAAMFSSDFIMGPLLSLELAALSLAAWGAETGEDLPVFAGASLLAYATWCRPEAAIVGAPLLAVAWPVVRSWRRRPIAWLGFGLFGANMIAAQVALRALGPTPSLVPGFPFAHAARFLVIPEDVPYWLSLGLLLAVALRRGIERRHAWLFTVGIVTGMWPLAIRSMMDPTRSHMELFRYGAWMLPWITLLCACGFVAAAGRLGERFGKAKRAGRARHVYLAVLAATTLFVLSSPVRARSYLSREYGPRAEERIFVNALGRVPASCTLIVPDDITELGRKGKGTIEIEWRYRAIAREKARLAGSTPHKTVGVTTFLDRLHKHGWPRRPDGAPACYWFFQGSYCYTGPDGVPAQSCKELLSAVHGRPVFDAEIKYVSHRFVTRPRLHRAPLYDAHQHLRLWKLSAPPD